MTETGLKIRDSEFGVRNLQTRFVMPIADDVRLVTVETARAARGVIAEDIFEAVDLGELPAFDFSLGDSRRELRIWTGALRGSRITDRDAIIADCLLTNVIGAQNGNFSIRNSQLETAWCVSNQMLLRFIALKLISGVRVGRNWKVNRFSAQQFLKGRML